MIYIITWKISYWFDKYINKKKDSFIFFFPRKEWHSVSVQQKSEKSNKAAQNINLWNFLKTIFFHIKSKRINEEFYVCIKKVLFLDDKFDYDHDNGKKSVVP